MLEAILGGGKAKPVAAASNRKIIYEDEKIDEQ